MRQQGRKALGPDPFEQEVAARIGVSRLGRITGLDRTGVEVACAVRPRGHVLQVSNGKGLSFEQARRGALMEAAELAFAEEVPLPEVVFGTARELAERVGPDAVWTPDEVGSAGALVAPELWSPEAVLGWRWGARLDRRGQVLVPACAVHCPAPGGPLIGPLVVRWTSNGSAVHTTADAARRHALFEAIERDQLARMLPEGWTERVAATRLLRFSSLPESVAVLQSQLDARGFESFVFDLTPERGLGVPVAGAVLLDGERGPIPVTAGYAAGGTAEEACMGALLEAAQSRLTEIHGAREDVAPEAREQALGFGEAIRSLRPRREFGKMVSLPPRARTVAGLTQLLAQNGHPSCAVRLSGAHVPIEAWKVIVKGFLVTELL